jgi:hypothetical protein
MTQDVEGVNAIGASFHTLINTENMVKAQAAAHLADDSSENRGGELKRREY